jgi:signal transduction histidine kinase
MMSRNASRPLWWQHTRSLIVLSAISASVVTTPPHPSWWGLGLASVVLLAVTVVARIPWTFEWSSDQRVVSASLVITALASEVLTFIVPHSAAIAFTAFGVIGAMLFWPVATASGFAIGLALLYICGQVALSRSLPLIVVGPAVIGAAVLVGIVQRQSEELSAQAQTARDEQAHSAALDERARIAREIHDVLAHSLAALTVQLETADALLESGRVEQARASVVRSSRLAREGLAETRRAIGALRGDTLPLPELLAMLTTAYEADVVAPATVHVDGEPREVRPDVALALYRTAQEAITNVRKHAPGAPVNVSLHYGSGEVALAVGNEAGTTGERPLADTGGGYGLTGLRERAELAGGTFASGPHGRGWRVDVRIPA